MQIVKIEITSEFSGVGKTTIGGIVKDALERCGYCVNVTGIAYTGNYLSDFEEFNSQEVAAIEKQKNIHLLDRPDKSHPYSDVDLVVHG